MVFNLVHWLPSVIAAILIVVIAFVRPKKYFKPLGAAIFFFAVIGLIGYLSNPVFNWFAWNSHTIHACFGIGTFLLSIFVYLSFTFKKMKKKEKKTYVQLSIIAGVLAILAMISGGLLFLGTSTQSIVPPQVPVQQVGEVEATEFLGVALTPIAQQGNNAIKGTQYIDRDTYELKVTGLVDETSFSYNELIALPAYSEVVDMNCVEGWGFIAKWTGFRVSDVLSNASGSYVMFFSADGYSSGMPLNYLLDNNILLAYKLNDLTLPPERGFPLQLVAKSKYGYKWVKWVTEIRVVSEEERGYWEARGYNNDADVGGPAFR